MLQGIGNLHTGQNRPQDPKSDVGPRGPKMAGQSADVGDDRAVRIEMRGGEKPVGAAEGGAPAATERMAAGVFEQYLGEILSKWKSSEATLQRAHAQLPPELRLFLEMQRSMNRTGVEIQLISSAAEALNQSLKRLQQTAGG